MKLPKINLPNMQKKYKIMAMIGILALLLGSYYERAYKPHAKKISELKESLLSLEDTIKVIKTIEFPSVKSNQEILNKLNSKKEATLKKIELEEKSLPKTSEFSKILERITRLAYDSGFIIKSIEPKDVTKKEDYQSMALNMEVNTNFANLLDFFKKIDELPISLETIQINVLERPALSIQMKLSILAK